MGKLSKLSKKRKEAAARKTKAAADAAAAADATAATAAAAAAAAAAASAAADAAADAASCAAAAAVVPAAPSGSGSATASNWANTHRSYAAAVANGPAISVNVPGETTSVVAASVAFPSSAATKSLKKAKLSVDVAVPAAMANCTGNAILPPAPDLLTMELKKKSPKKRGNLVAAVGHGATDASVPSKLRHPSRGTDRKTSTAKGASFHPIAEDDAHPIVPAEKAPLAAKKLKL